MPKRFFLILCLFLCLPYLICAQINNKLALVTPGGTSYLPVYERQGIVYFSINHFANATSASYYINDETKKIELKYSDYNLKITGQNPFIVLTSKNNNIEKVYQLPTSTYLINNYIFIPLRYSVEILRKASGQDIVIENNSKVVIKGKPESEVPDENAGLINISGLKIDQKANGILIRVKTNKRIPSYYSSYKNGLLTIIFRKVNADISRLSKGYSAGLVKSINIKNIGPDTQFEFRVSNEYSTSEVLNIAGSKDILITIHNKIFSNEVDNDKNKEKWKFDVIVLDAGHGGKDAGAIGINGIKEKDVNLRIALALGKLIERSMKNVKVVYTRKTDKFVELYRRGQIANENDGKLFISIHCNSTRKKPTDATGFEVYLLRPGRTKEAIAIAEEENSVIRYEDNPKRYEKLTDENFILVSMAHSAYIRYSEEFSELVNKNYSLETNIPSRGIKQAGFYVLVGASMPSVLIETGFISNRHDARYLSGSKGEKEIAKALFDAIKSYKKYYESTIENE
jgi:N-acetylmuramoyl-L-alanine amidase